MLEDGTRRGTFTTTPSSRSAPSRREVLHSTPSAHVAVVCPSLTSPKAKRGQQTAAPFERMWKAQRNFGCANPPCMAPVDGARRVVRRADARTQMAWLPAMASLHGDDTSHPMFAVAFMGKRVSDGQPSSARGGQGRRPRAGEDQRLADVPARPSSLQKSQFRASVSSKRNLSSHDSRRGNRAARAETSSPAASHTRVWNAPNEQTGGSRSTPRWPNRTIDRRSRGSTACILPRVWPTGDPGRRNSPSHPSTRLGGSGGEASSELWWKALRIVDVTLSSRTA